MDTHGRRTLAKVTTPWLTGIRDDLAAGTYKVGPKDEQIERRRKPGAVNRQLTNLKTVLSYCVEIGWMPRSPAVKKLTECKRVRFLSDAKLTALTTALGECAERVMLPFTYCALSSGPRAGELLGLEWKDVDLAKGVATIHTSKSGEGRKLYFRGKALGGSRHECGSPDGQRGLRLRAWKLPTSISTHCSSTPWKPSCWPPSNGPATIPRQS
jgi:integrase